ncbi:MAG: hypothetical protein ABJN34_05110 [Litoreibacter sp.]|uniref:hypothetical protein n=1 Tax=Litoreibacter sp. TaxID=1969459 RepID=UPI0032983B2C
MTSLGNDTPWMTTEAAASYLTVSPGTMHNWRSKGVGRLIELLVASSAITATTLMSF